MVSDRAGNVDNMTDQDITTGSELVEAIVYINDSFDGRIVAMHPLPLGLGEAGAIIGAVASVYPDAVVTADHPATDRWLIICNPTGGSVLTELDR